MAPARAKQACRTAPPASPHNPLTQIPDGLVEPIAWPSGERKWSVRGIVDLEMGFGGRSGPVHEPDQGQPRGCAARDHRHRSSHRCGHLNTAWSRLGCVCNEAAFAALAVGGPTCAPSGTITRSHLNRGGDRRVNRALHMAAVRRMVQASPKRTETTFNAARQKGSTQKRVAAASSATSPGVSTEPPRERGPPYLG